MIDVEKAKKKLTPEALEIIQSHGAAIHDELTALGDNVEIMHDGKIWPFTADTSFRDGVVAVVGHYVFNPER